MVQAADQKAAWRRANRPDSAGYTPAQRRMVEVLLQLRYRHGTQAYHGDIAIAAWWYKLGGCPTAPLHGVLCALHARGTADKDPYSTRWRLRKVPDHMLEEITHERDQSGGAAAR